MIELYQFPRPRNFPNISPFCVKLECFLRMNDLPYTIHAKSYPGKMPKGKFPAIKIDGEMMGDSSFIIARLKKQFHLKIDEHLSSSEKATLTAYQRLFEDSLIPIGVYFRLAAPGISDNFRKAFFRKLPFPMNLIGAKLVRRRYLKRAMGQGLARHSTDELVQILQQNLQAVDELLGDKKYFFGDKYSSLDAIAFGVLGNCNLPSVKPLHESMQKFPRLQKFAVRMQDEFFPELSRAEQKK